MSLRKGDRVDTPKGRGTITKVHRGAPFPKGTVRYVVKLDGRRGEFSRVLFHQSELSYQGRATKHQMLAAKVNR